MPVTRREFLNLAATGVVARLAPSSPPTRATTGARIRAVAFDAFPIFDPRPVAALADQLFPGRGGELTSAWRTRQFEYQWLRALSRQYVDFWQTTEDALVYAAELLGLDLGADEKRRLMTSYLDLRAWPDVPAALQALAAADIRLALLSNATPTILASGIANAGLGRVFEQVISTDAIRSYKPDPRAYQMATDALSLRKEDILFVAFAGWDAAGAKAFGYRTFWVNRLNLPTERLGAAPDGAGPGLADLVAFVAAQA